MVALTSACTPALAYIGPGSGLSLLGGLWSLVVGIVIALAAVLMWPIRLLLRRLGWLRPVVPAATGDRDSTADDHGPHAPSARLPGPRSLLAVLIGGALAGVLGLILAIPVAACAHILAREVILPRWRAYAA